MPSEIRQMSAANTFQDKLIVNAERGPVSRNAQSSEPRSQRLADSRPALAGRDSGRRKDVPEVIDGIDVPWCSKLLDIGIMRRHLSAHHGTSRSAL